MDWPTIPDSMNCGLSHSESCFAFDGDGDMEEAIHTPNPSTHTTILFRPSWSRHCGCKFSRTMTTMTMSLLPLCIESMAPIRPREDSSTSVLLPTSNGLSDNGGEYLVCRTWRCITLVGKDANSLSHRCSRRYRPSWRMIGAVVAGPFIVLYRFFSDDRGTVSVVANDAAEDNQSFQLIIIIIIIIQYIFLRCIWLSR